MPTPWRWQGITLFSVICTDRAMADEMHVFYVYHNNRHCGIVTAMKISQKGLYALQALMMLARHYNQGAIRIRDIAYE